MTRIEAGAKAKALVTLRFAGDKLYPGEISAVLPTEPTRDHRKGEKFFSGPRSGYLHGRIGIWQLATDKLVASDDLQDHFAAAQKLLSPTPRDPSRITELHEFSSARIPPPPFVLLVRRHRRVPSTTPDWFKSAIAPLAADIENDFGTELC